MLSPKLKNRARIVGLIFVPAVTLTCASKYYLDQRARGGRKTLDQSSKMTSRHPFETLFAVPMHCDSCVKDISETLYKVDGISKVDADLSQQLVSITGTAPPSKIVEAIQAGGRDAILRGSGTSDSSAAVSILETFARPPGHDASLPEDEDKHRDVRGLARMVQVSPDTTLVDLTLRGVAPGTYTASIREYGNLARGASTTGPVWGTAAAAEAAKRKGLLGVLTVGADGRGAAFLDREFAVWEVIGRAMVVTRQGEEEELENDFNTLVGVVARSAGVWDNDKTVCSCTGKTLWEERKDEVKKGML